MRFINTSSLKFHEVSDLQLHKLKNGYSILSHRWTWGENEIMYVDVLSMNSDVKAKDGYSKFAGACSLAKRLGYELIWIDTCCINKTDSVELGEAINSMYRWYSMAKVCIAFLQDVVSSTQINESEWFNRGWTLQELIAPKIVQFYNRNWTYLGDKASLSNVLVNRTGIPADVLKNKTPPQNCSIAQRMSWAAKRTTGRLEDRAYSLMGLFDVNMPMIYGERERAFIRLQEQIISKSTDESIFAWDLDILEESKRDAKQVYCGLLATSPACFARCGDLVSIGRSRGFRIGQFGLSILLPATLYTLDTYLAPLKVTKANVVGQCAIVLAKLPEGGSFARISSSSGESIVMTEKVEATSKEFMVSLEPIERPPHLFHGFWLRKLSFYDSHISGYTVLNRLYSEESRFKLPDNEVGTAGIIRIGLLKDGASAGFGWIKLGFDSACHPICFMTFPDIGDENSDVEMMNAEAEQLLVVRQKSPHSPDRINHPIFNNDWTQASSQTISNLPSHSYDSRRGTGDSENGFEFTFKAPLFEITASARRVPDITPTITNSSYSGYGRVHQVATPTSGGKSEVWAVEIVAGTDPGRYDHDDDGCCC